MKSFIKNRRKSDTNESIIEIPLEYSPKKTSPTHSVIHSPHLKNVFSNKLFKKSHLDNDSSANDFPAIKGTITHSWGSQPNEIRAQIINLNNSQIETSKQTLIYDELTNSNLETTAYETYTDKYDKNSPQTSDSNSTTTLKNSSILLVPKLRQNTQLVNERKFKNRQVRIHSQDDLEELRSQLPKITIIKPSTPKRTVLDNNSDFENETDDNSSDTGSDFSFEYAGINGRTSSVKYYSKAEDEELQQNERLYIDDLYEDENFDDDMNYFDDEDLDNEEGMLNQVEINTKSIFAQNTSKAKSERADIKKSGTALTSYEKIFDLSDDIDNDDEVVTDLNEPYDVEDCAGTHEMMKDSSIEKNTNETHKKIDDLPKLSDTTNNGPDLLNGKVEKNCSKTVNEAKSKYRLNSYGDMFNITDDDEDDEEEGNDGNGDDGNGDDSCLREKEVTKTIDNDARVHKSRASDNFGETESKSFSKIKVNVSQKLGGNFEQDASFKLLEKNIEQKNNKLTSYADMFNISDEDEDDFFDTRENRKDEPKVTSFSNAANSCFKIEKKEQPKPQTEYIKPRIEIHNLSDENKHNKISNSTNVELVSSTKSNSANWKVSKYNDLFDISDEEEDDIYNESNKSAFGPNRLPNQDIDNFSTYTNDDNYYLADKPNWQDLYLRDSRLKQHPPMKTHNNSLFLSDEENDKEVLTPLTLDEATDSPLKSKYFTPVKTTLSTATNSKELRHSPVSPMSNNSSPLGFGLHHKNGTTNNEMKNTKFSNSIGNRHTNILNSSIDMSHPLPPSTRSNILKFHDINCRFDSEVPDLTSTLYFIDEAEEDAYNNQNGNMNLEDQYHYDLDEINTVPEDFEFPENENMKGAKLKLDKFKSSNILSSYNYRRTHSYHSKPLGITKEDTPVNNRLELNDKTVTFFNHTWADDKYKDVITPPSSPISSPLKRKDEMTISFSKPFSDDTMNSPSSLSPIQESVSVSSSPKKTSSLSAFLGA